MSPEHDPNVGTCDTHLWLITGASPGEVKRERDYSNFTHHLPLDFLFNKTKERRNEWKEERKDG